MGFGVRWGVMNMRLICYIEPTLSPIPPKRIFLYLSKPKNPYFVEGAGRPRHASGAVPARKDLETAGEKEVKRNKQPGTRMRTKTENEARQ